MCHFPHAARANMPTTLPANITCGRGGGGLGGVASGRGIFLDSTPTTNMPQRLKDVA